jgi:phage-related protein
MEIFKLFGSIALKNGDANRGIDETTGKAEGASVKIGAAFEKIGSFAVKAGQTIAVGLAAGATAIAGLVKSSLDSYAEYEQLVGGVETLYGAKYNTLQEYIDGTGAAVEFATETFERYQNREQTVLENASNAYKTAGMSANDYMNTVNGFAASLTSSLGEYEFMAANYADMIVTDMADNANKMGTSMDMIQNAYSGFAKQNYTMLDNLKLGYGGTKSEMERLLRDAEKYAGYIEGSLKVESFADIADAIHIVQEEMGITGTTAKEASSTIEGSLSMTKAAWQNLVTGFADDTQDLDVLVGNLVDSGKTAIENIMPRIQTILGGVVDFVGQIVPVISAELPGLLQALLPGLIQASTSLMVGLITALPQILQILLEQLPFIISQISGALVTAFPALLETVKTLFQQIWDYISLELLNTGVSFEDTFAKVKEVFEDVWGALQDVWHSLGEPIFDLIQNLLGSTRDKFSEKMPEIKEFVSGCFSDIKDFWENNLKPCFDAIGDFIENTLAPKFEEIFQNRILPIVDTVFSAIKDFWNNTLKPVFTGITEFLTGVFTGDWERAWNGVKDILKGVVNGIINSVEFMANMAVSGLNAIIGGINDLAAKAGEKIGLNISIPEIKGISLPRLEKGGVLERGQIGFLEGNGAEAVVPLDQNKKWIAAVAAQMNEAFGSNQNEIKELTAAFKAFVDILPEIMADAFGTMTFDINNREFARLVKAVN